MIADDIVKDMRSVFFDPICRQVRLHEKTNNTAYQGSSYGISMALFIEIRLDWDNDAARRRRVTGMLQDAFCVVNVWSSNNRGNPISILIARPYVFTNQ